MNHSTSTDIFGMEFANVQRNREAAIRALAAMPVKPIRKMGPADYRPREEPKRVFVCERDRAMERLGERCVKAIQDNNGPLTTAELGRILRVSTQAIGHALAERDEVNKSPIEERSMKTGRMEQGWKWAAKVSGR